MLVTRKVACIFKQKNDFTWPEESSAAHMARKLYFALQNMSKFLLPFLCGFDYNGQACTFG